MEVRLPDQDGAGIAQGRDARRVVRGEVVASQYGARREVARTETGALVEAWDMLLERTVLLKLAWRDPGAASLLLEARRCSGVASDAAAAGYSVYLGALEMDARRLATTAPTQAEGRWRSLLVRARELGHRPGVEEATGWLGTG